MVAVIGLGLRDDALASRKEDSMTKRDFEKDRRNRIQIDKPTDPINDNPEQRAERKQEKPPILEKIAKLTRLLSESWKDMNLVQLQQVETALDSLIIKFAIDNQGAPVEIQNARTVQKRIAERIANLRKQIPKSYRIVRSNQGRRKRRKV